MIDNKTIEILAENNPFLMSGITNETIGYSFSVDSSGLSIGDVVCMSEMYNELIRRFGTYENAKKIYQYARSLIVGGEYPNVGEDSVPYLNFTVYLEQEMVDNGILTPYIEQWIPGKKYHVGDAVYYSIDGTNEATKVYILENSDGEFDKVEITKDEYEANQEYENYIKEGERYYVKVPYYCGYYDEKTHLIYFDTLRDGELVFNHWKENIIEDEEATTAIIEGTIESSLKTVMRRRTDMDASGVTLPFILHYNIEGNHRVLDETTTETFYMCGKMNMEYINGVTCDILDSVTFYNDEINSEQRYDIEHNENEPILAGDIDDEYDKVRFVYYIGATIEKGEDNKWNRKEGTGIKYVEIRNFTKEIGEFTIEKGRGTVTVELPYISIVSDLSATDYNDDMRESAIEISAFSNITAENEVNKKMLHPIVTFKDENTNRLQNTIDDINIKVERGMADSFEKHNMLGEICTMQDLENYKNGKYLDKK